MTVIVRHDYLTGEKADKDWWMGQVIHAAELPVIRAFTTCSRSPMWTPARSAGSTLTW
jgi:hypothetical protein